MRLLADECCNGDLVAALRDAGYDVISIAKTLPRIDDLDVLAMARIQDRNLIADDKDSGDLAVRRLQPASGVVLLRTKSIDPTFDARRILDLISMHGPELQNLFCVIEEARFRIRDLRSLDP